MAEEYDVVVIGAGPGGYVAAIRAGQLGMRTAVVEREFAGGVCLNWGCIPSKAIIRCAELVSLARRGEEFGIQYDNVRFDYGVAIDRSRKVAEHHRRGVEYLFRKYKVDHIKGEASLRDARTVEVSPDGRTLTAKNVIIATGARARSIPPLPVDGQLVVTYREAIVQRDLPQSVVVVGGGAIGVEFGYVYNAYGAKVTIVEMLPHLLPNEDEEVSRELERALSRQGIQVLTNSQVTGMERTPSGAKVSVKTPDGDKQLECQRVLVAIGIQGNSQNLGLERLGVPVERSFIKVDQSMSTGVPGVYAIGDVTGKMALAHVAFAQATMVVEGLAGRETRPLEYIDLPRATYCKPQVTSFGLTEKQARDQGLKVKVGKFPFTANGKASAVGEREGFVKLVVDERYGEILGAHLIGPEVTELLAEISMTKLLEGTTLELGWQVHSHPTLSEAIKEAALSAQGAAIHI